MYKIYFLDKVLQIGGKENESAIPTKKVKNKKEFLNFFRSWLQDDNRQSYRIKGYKSKKMFRHLKNSIHYVKAAGGVIRNQENEILFIKRWGIWDLPKGKKEKTEDIIKCALREVREETGVENLNIVSLLPSSYHIYFHKGEAVLKKTWWFAMETNSTGPLQPQREEDITEAVWLNKKECNEALSKSYRSLRESIGKSICKLI